MVYLMLDNDRREALQSLLDEVPRAIRGF